ncbi:energy transducer TonB [Alkalitalea saponilacus]|uniref:Protein TonB n=1 Tax=Alkalitalea saponilacus TaxID=889453 RepID=A0A1T5HST3_9BACT|nr:energy transducer TonB [Alkalitalea saponilacus]ASB49259.1 energy transducer TonB [Alkalitalea saponilacus]SKC23745.1 protein TonB [Alkalitalea saponilacus]
MDTKKSPKADLESKKTVFMQIGLVVTLSLVLIAFEWTTTEVNINLGLMDIEEEVEEEIIPITRQEEVPPPPPPPPPAVTDILNIVDDDIDLDEELEIFDTEMHDDSMIDFVDMDFEEERDDGEIFIIVEEMPEFPGGIQALQRYLAQSIRYPVIAQENGIQGRVYIQFVINQNGEVTNATVLRGVDPSLDREALRVVQAMPNWTPGRQRNRPVRVSYTVPINFVLQ